MKKLTDYRELIVCLITLLLAGQTAFSQLPEITWEKNFEIRESHYFSDVLELPGGNFILLGAIEKPGDRSFDIWILECSNKGDTLKTKTFQYPGNDIPLRIVASGENGFVIAYMSQTDGSERFARLLAVDLTFSELWTSVSEQPSSILRTDVATDPSGFIWWLNTFSGPDEKAIISVRKIDREGNKTAEFSFEESNPAAGYAIRALPDGTLGISCQVHPPNGKSTIQVIRIDASGKELWKSVVPKSEKILTPQCLCCSPDNTLLVGGWAGLCYNPDAPAEEQIWDYDYLLTKLDATGKILWTQNYNREGSEKGTAIAVLPNGNIMAAGKCETSFTGSIGPWLLFIDKNGKMVKDQVFKFRFMQDQAARIVCTSDGGFLLVGPGYIETDHRLAGWVKKLSPVL